MRLIDAGKLALFALKKWGAVLRDKAGNRRDLPNGSLPFDPDIIATPATLNYLLNNYCVEKLPAPAQVSRVTVQDVPSISSNCHNLILSLEQEGEAVLPDSVFVKLPLPSLTMHWFFSLIGSWQLESHFCRVVAPNVPLRTPITYATAAPGTRFFLVQENLRDDPNVKLFTNFDMLQGPGIEQARRCLDAFARLHACHYGLGAVQREAILPLGHHPFTSPTFGLVSRTMNAMALKPCLKKAPGIIPDAVAEVYRKTQQHWPSLLSYWFSEPLCLLHGDSHIGNFFVSGDEMGLLDFQAVHWGKGIRDVQYFLIDSLPADQLAANEQDLVSYYVARRAHYGAAIDFEQTWEEYRSFTYHTLMTIVVSIGFGALNAEQDTLMREILKRSVAAVQRVDYASWLEEFLHGRVN